MTDESKHLLKDIEILPSGEDESDLSSKELEKIEDKLLPAIIEGRELIASEGASNPLTLYMREISRYPLLSPEDEKRLAIELKETGDLDVAKVLVRSNLRLVVKIAMEYRSAYQNTLDLIQEGNIGLMKAVSKYDPDKGAKLSYYASWWIKSYILKFILDNFRLIKIGTTADQKKLFFNLMKEKTRLEGMGIKPETKLIADNLGVSEKSVTLMNHRLSSAGSEISLDMPVGDEGGSTISDFVASEGEALDDRLGDLQNLQILKDHLHNFLDSLKSRDREIFEQRLLQEVPLSLQAIADQYGVSRERIRQIEERLLGQLRSFMSEYLS